MAQLVNIMNATLIHKIQPSQCNTKTNDINVCRIKLSAILLSPANHTQISISHNLHQLINFTYLQTAEHINLKSEHKNIYATIFYYCHTGTVRIIQNCNCHCIKICQKWKPTIWLPYTISFTFLLYKKSSGPNITSNLLFE